MNVAEAVTLIASGKACKFISLTYKAKETGEIARHTLIVGASTEKLYEKDIAQLETALTTLAGIDKLAASEILASRKKSLEVGIGNNPAYTCRGVYAPLAGMSGIKVHMEKGTLYVSGLVESKKVLVAGTYKEVNSSEKTLAKRAIEKTLPSGRFRQFCLTFDNLLRVAANGETLEIATVEV